MLKVPLGTTVALLSYDSAPFSVDAPFLSEHDKVGARGHVGFIEVK